ncbi:MAG TPA: anti-sigma factor [Jatrophihabitans sp.]|nr:anti-sigma factor [Jatrophihabitans sp.]
MTDDQRAAYLAGDDAAAHEPVALPASDVAALDDLRGLLADHALWAEPPAELGERVVAAVAAARENPATGPTPLHAVRRASHRRWIMLSAAAAVIIALALGVFFGTRTTSNPEKFAATLAATELQPNASGDVTLTKSTSGWRIELHADGLPRRDNGRYYEAWLKSADGVLVPVGTFNDGRDVTLWSAVSPADFTTFTITRQVVGAGEDSSGQVVLAGTTKRA